MNMIMFKFGPPPSVQVIAAPTPTTPTTAAAAVLGMGMGGSIEVGETVLLLFWRDSSDDDHERGAQEARDAKEELLQLQQDANVFDNTETPVVDEDEDEETVMARCRRRCRWDSPEAWLVQSDSVDEKKVSVAAMV
jgi:hypothetical protein